MAFGIGKRAVRAAAHGRISFATLLKLGRVSNLPTVWTNVLAGTVIAGGSWQSRSAVVVMLAASLLYIGGMYLNDFFDRAIDARERPQRPIPAGEISSTSVAVLGFGMLCAGTLLMAATDFPGLLASILLAVAIIGYDAFHKHNPVAPLVMGLCRTLVYAAAAAAAVGSISVSVAVAGLGLMCYVAAITYAAQHESLDKLASVWPLLMLGTPIMLGLPAVKQGIWATIILLGLIGWTGAAVYTLVRPVRGSVSMAVSFLIAGISLVDAVFLAAVGAALPALAAILGFAITLVAHRYIAGT